MKKPVNDKMIKLDEVIRVMDEVSQHLGSKEKSLIESIKQQVLKIDTRPRLTIINGGKNV